MINLSLTNCAVIWLVQHLAILVTPHDYHIDNHPRYIHRALNYFILANFFRLFIVAKRRCMFAEC